MAEWITPDDVADHLGTVDPTDQRVIRSTAAVKAAVEARHAGRFEFTDDTTVPANLQLGAVMWAAVLVQQRSAPSGYDGYDAETALADAGAKRGEILRLVRWFVPVVG